MSVARPAVALRRGLTQRILGARFATTDSNPIAGPSAPSPSPKNQNQGKHYDPTLTHNVLPYHVIPRPQKYTSPFEYQPLHKSINHPRPVFVRPTNPADIPEYEGENRKEKRELALAAVTGLEPAELRKIRRTTIALKRVCRMSKKGKQYSWLAYVLVGMPDKGMVGFGRGRSNDSTVKAIDDAFFEACVEMDYVNRYEDRTLWGQGAELRTKFVRTQVDLRARPPGFGLQVPPPIHRVLSACGVRDASASINGSMNAVMVTKAVIQVLHGGGNPPGFGGGRFGSGKRKNKGHGMRSKEDIERQRGRYGVDIGLRV